MPAPAQSQTPVYKDTSNISRFQTNWAQHSSSREAGSAIARALGVAADVVVSEAEDQKAKDLAEGKRLAFMGVARENIKDAASGQGVFSGIGGWTEQGFDLQRGVEDAFIRQQKLIEDYSASGLADTDDLGAFQSFVDQQREAILADLKDAPEYYREGFMEGIAPAFQKMGRAWAGHADAFRAGKRRSALQGRAGTAIATGNQRDVVAIIDNAPKELGISHRDAKEAVTEQLVRDIQKGSVSDVDPDVYKKLNRDQKDRIDQAKRERTEFDDRQAVAAEMVRQRELRSLKERAVTGDQEAWNTLKDEHPEEFRKLFGATTDSADKPKPSAAYNRQVDQLVKGSQQWGSQDMSQTLLELFEGGRIDQDQYIRLTQENSRATVARETWKDNSANSFVVTQKAVSLRGEQRLAFDGLMDQQISDFVEANNRKPTAAEISSMASDAAAIAKGEM